MVPTLPDPEIVRLRTEISAIDRSVVLLLAARARVQQQLFGRKVELGLPLRDRAQERRVLERVEEWSHRYGADERVATATVRLAMRHGLDAAGAGDLGNASGDGPVTVFFSPTSAGGLRPTAALVREVAPRRAVAALLAP